MGVANRIVVGSGKGGVGKSVVSILLAATLAARGRRVLLLDGDQNLGNLHVLLGIRPTACIDALLRDDVAPAELVQPVAPNLWLIAGGSGVEALHGLDELSRARLHYRVSALSDEYDAVIVDTGAGIESALRVTIDAARLVLVTAPEPAALTDAYALMKIVSHQLPALPIDVLVNRCLTENDGRQAYTKLATAAARFLQHELHFLGALLEEHTIRTAVRDPARLLETIVTTDVARTIADTVLARVDIAPFASVHD